MGKNKFVHWSRKFLNRPKYNAGAFIIAEIERLEYDEVRKDGKIRQQKHVDFDASLTLSDCGRQITLDFTMYSRQRNKGENKNVLYKADLLRDEINAFVDALHEAAKEMGVE